MGTDNSVGVCTIASSAVGSLSSSFTALAGSVVSSKLPCVFVFLLLEFVLFFLEVLFVFFVSFSSSFSSLSSIFSLFSSFNSSSSSFLLILSVPPLCLLYEKRLKVLFARFIFFFPLNVLFLLDLFFLFNFFFFRLCFFLLYIFDILPLVNFISI